MTAHLNVFCFLANVIRSVEMKPGGCAGVFLNVVRWARHLEIMCYWSQVVWIWRGEDRNVAFLFLCFPTLVNVTEVKRSLIWVYSSTEYSVSSFCNVLSAVGRRRTVKLSSRDSCGRGWRWAFDGLYQFHLPSVLGSLCLSWMNFSGVERQKLSLMSHRTRSYQAGRSHPQQGIVCLEKNGLFHESMTVPVSSQRFFLSFPSIYCFVVPFFFFDFFSLQYIHRYIVSS